MLVSRSPVGLFFLFFFFTVLPRSISRSVFHDLFAILFLIEALWPQNSLQTVWNCYIMICCLVLYSASSWTEPVRNEQVKPPAWCYSLRNQSASNQRFLQSWTRWDLIDIRDIFVGFWHPNVTVSPKQCIQFSPSIKRLSAATVIID